MATTRAITTRGQMVPSPRGRQVLQFTHSPVADSVATVGQSDTPGKSNFGLRCSRTRASILRHSRRTNWPRTARRFGSWAAAIVTDQEECSATTELRTRIWSFDDGSASSRSSNHNAQPRDFSPLTPLFTTPSIRKSIHSSPLPSRRRSRLARGDRRRMTKSRP